MDDLEIASADAAGAEVVSSTPAVSEATPAPSFDDDASLEALYDKIAAPKEEPEAAPVPAAAAPNPDQPQNGEPAPVITPASDAPHSWSAEMKAHWANVPPEARAYIAQRETAAHEQISRMGQEVARYKPYGELIEARQDVFDRNGFNAIDGLGKLFEAQELLEQNPLQGIAAIAQQFGVDLAAVYGGQPGQQPDPNAVNPQVQQLTQTVRQLEQKLAQRENTERAQAERDTLARREEAKSQVTKWSEGKTHFANEAVRTLMGTLMSNGQAKDLDAAYDQACHAVPEVRQTILAEQQKADAAKKLADDAKAAADAKKARGVNGGSRPGTKASGGKWDDDEYLEATLSRIAS
jgi:hypothetical protein